MGNARRSLPGLQQGLRAVMRRLILTTTMSRLKRLRAVMKRALVIKYMSFVAAENAECSLAMTRDAGKRFPSSADLTGCERIII